MKAAVFGWGWAEDKSSSTTQETNPPDLAPTSIPGLLLSSHGDQEQQDYTTFHLSAPFSTHTAATAAFKCSPSPAGPREVRSSKLKTLPVCRLWPGVQRIHRVLAGSFAKSWLSAWCPHFRK